MRRIVATTVLLQAVMLLADPRTAQACVAPQCAPTNVLLAPATGREIPANAPAVAVNGWAGVDIVGAQVSAGDGGVVAVTNTGADARARLLTFRELLTPGEAYAVHVTGSCNGAPSGDGGNNETVSTFRATAPAPLPTTLGTARAVYVQDDGSGPDAGADTFAHRRVLIRVAPSADLQPYLAVTRFDVQIDGATWYTSSYGALAAGTTQLTSLVSFDAACSGEPRVGSCPGSAELAPGRHVARPGAARRPCRS